MRVAVVSGVTALRCRWTVSSVMSAPALTRCVTASPSSCHSRRSPGSRSTTEPIVIAWSSCSTIAADTCASCSIHATCSAEEVG